MSDPAIQFDRVYKKYPGQTALQDVTFELPKGKIIGVVGPNGSGKSTLLKLAAGLIRPSQGTIHVNGLPTERRNSKHLSFLSELDVYYPFYTVGETVQFFSEQYADFDMQKANEMLHFMGLSVQQHVRNLSKGNRGRLKIVLTLSRDVPLVLMDEPLSGIDPMARDSIIKGIITFINLEQQTVLLSTHEVSEVEPLLDWVVAIYEGRVMEIADTDGIRERNGQSLIDWMKNTLT